MKTVLSLFLCVFLLTNNYLEAQSLVKEDRLWSNTMTGYDGGIYYNSNYIKFEGDTIINDTVFKNIYRSDDELHSKWYKVGAIREDSLKRVFLFQNGIQRLLYDFSLQTGDSIVTFMGMSVYVIATEYISLENFENPLKKISLSIYKNSDYADCSWIEEIGSTCGVLEGADQIGMVGAGYLLVCYSENNILKYKHEIFDSCFPIGKPENIESDENESVRINILYDSNYVFFDFGNIDTQNSEIWVFNISGKVEGRYNIGGLSILEIPKTDLDSGLYIFRFMNNRKLIGGKFIID